MYAVIKTGGKQYRVAKDDVLTIERMPGEAGATIEFAEVLLVGSGETVKIGTPVVSGAKVTAELVEPDARPEAHRFQEAPPQEFAPQEGPPSGPFDRAHHQHHRRLIGCPDKLEDLIDGTKESRRLD